MQVQIVTGESRQKVLAEAKRKLGKDPLVLSVRRRQGHWEAMVAKDTADELVAPEVGPADAVDMTPSVGADRLGGLREEVARLRAQLAAGRAPQADVMALAHRLTMLEHDLLGATLSGRQVSPRWSPLFGRLQASGYTHADALAVIEALDAEAPRDEVETRRALRALLTRNVEVASAAERVKPRLVAFCGAAGVGKTSLAAKLAADLSLGGSRTPVLGVLNPRPGAGREVIRGCAHTLGLEYVEASSEAQLVELWHRSEERPIILDSAAVSPREDSIERMAALFRSVPDAEVHAVIPANYGDAEFCRTLGAFSCFPRVRMSVTRFDESPRPGRILSAAAKTGVPVGYFSLGPRIPDDLARPGLQGLAESVLLAEEVQS